MENKSRINGILSDVIELEHLLADALKADIYPVSFFSRSFDLAHHLLKDLHILESEQTEVLRKQMEEYRRMIDDASSVDAAEPLEGILSIPISSPPKIEPARQPATLNDAIEKKNLSDLRKALTLNERFYFRKELFGGDEARMNRAIVDLNEAQTYEQSQAYLRNVLKWDEENPVVAEFITMLEKRFH